MPQTLTPSAPVSLPRIRWTSAQYENLFAAGLLPDDQYELIEGDIVPKMPIKYPHIRVITLLFQLMSGIYGFEVLLSQFSLGVSNDSLPEPDFAVARTAHPALTPSGYVPADALRLVVEVSDATLDRDLTSKATLYARAGIPEYGVVDISNRRLVCHTDPTPEGYRSVTAYGETEYAAPLDRPEAAFLVANILP